MLGSNSCFMFYLQMLSKIFSEGEGLGGEDPEYFDPRLHQDTGDADFE